MKKWWKSALLATLTCLVVIAATAAEPDDAAADAAVPEIAPAQTPAAPEAAQEVVDTEVPDSGLEATTEEVEARISSSGGVVCTFLCNDGIGFLYNCPDPGMGTCCLQAQPACASHEGLDNGICRKGRLGLPCTPL